MKSKREVVTEETISEGVTNIDMEYIDEECRDF